MSKHRRPAAFEVARSEERLRLIGSRFGRLVVTGIRVPVVAHGAKRRVIASCLCDCGKETEVRLCNLRSGHSTACGSHQRRPNSIGSKRMPTYGSWSSAKARCYNVRDRKYAYYGGRGIEMCERWRNSFMAFLSDMGPRPPGTTLDRYPNNDGHYEPGNCRWATRKEQGGNTRRCVRITLPDGTSMIQADLAAKIRVSGPTLANHRKRDDFHVWLAAKVAEVSA